MSCSDLGTLIARVWNITHVSYTLAGTAHDMSDCFCTEENAEDDVLGWHMAFGNTSAVRHVCPRSSDVLQSDERSAIEQRCFHITDCGDIRQVMTSASVLN